MKTKYKKKRISKMCKIELEMFLSDFNMVTKECELQGLTVKELIFKEICQKEGVKDFKELKEKYKLTRR